MNLPSRRTLAFFALFTPVALGLVIAGGLADDGRLTWSIVGLLLLAFTYGIYRLVAWFSRLVDSEQALRSIFNHAMVGIGRITLDKYWIETNPALCRMLGYSPEEMRHLSFVEITHPDDRAASEQFMATVRNGEKSSYTLEKRYLRKDGSVLHALIAAQGIYDDKNRLTCLAVVVEDITLRYETQHELNRRISRSSLLLDLPLKAETMSEQAFVQYALAQAENLTESSIGFVRFIDEHGAGELFSWSQKALEQYCSPDETTPCPLCQVGPWADAAQTRQPVVINDYARAEDKHGLPEGPLPLTRLLSVPVTEGGAVRMLAGLANKATDYTGLDIETLQLVANEIWRIVRRQRIEAALRQATQVVNASPVVCFRWAASEGWPVVFVSDNVRQWGYAPEDLKAGRPPFAELVHPDDLARVVDEVSRHTAAGQSRYEQEYRLITADDKAIWVVDRTQVIRRADGSVQFYDGVLTDITERKEQQLALAENLRQQQQLNKRLEEANSQLLQSEKMASIGQLAAGIAHELNNPIGFVHSNLGTLDGYLHDLMAIIDAYDKATQSADCTCRYLPAVDQVKAERDFAFVKSDIFSLVAESKEGLARVRKIVVDLKSFSRVGEQEWQEADLHQGLDSTLNIVWNELKYKCKVVKEYGDIPRVHCLISQLNQVFMNLLVNAGHAIETQGTIAIRTRRHDAEHVCVEIADTGKGILPEHINRIFEPFFTTKPVGKGTGLGLSLSYNIVQKHHGRIEVDSVPGQGSSFRVILPVRPPDPEPAPEAA